MAAVQQVPAGFDPRAAQNHQDIERQFAVKAVLHAQTFWNILEKVKGSDLRLTKLDNEIFEHFKNEFPEIDVSKVIDENAMKSKQGKERWRKFMQAYDKKIEDYNFGTLMRNDAKAEYSETTTIFVQRMQFYAFEIARNKLGLNDWIKEAVDKEEAKNVKGEAKTEKKATAEDAAVTKGKEKTDGSSS